MIKEYKVVGGERFNPKKAKKSLVALLDAGLEFAEVAVGSHNLYLPSFLEGRMCHVYSMVLTCMEEGEEREKYVAELKKVNEEYKSKIEAFYEKIGEPVKN